MVLADAGYCNEGDLSELEARGIDGYVAPGREGKRVADKDVKRHPATRGMVEKLATPTGRERYAQRKWLSEAPNGWIKACPRMVLSGGSARIPGVQRAGSGQGAGGIGLGVPGAEPQAGAAASGSVRALARWWDMAKIVPTGGLDGLSRPSRVPCLPLRTCGVPALVFIPASSPARSTAHVLELPFYGADS